MKIGLLNKERAKQASEYAVAAALCLLILFCYLKLWKADLRVPFYYAGDTVFYAMCVKGMIDNGWYWQNAFVGAPDGLLMYDFPWVDHSVGVLLWLISIFTHNFALVLNIFYLLTFPLVTLTSLFVFRHFKLSYIPSLFCSLLYAFLPYHFLRNENHLILSAYYGIPLVTMVLLWITAEQFSLRSKRFIFSAVICALIGASGVYYPFFSCFLLLVAGAIGSLKFQSFRPLMTTIVLVGITGSTLLISLSPSFVYKYRRGDAGVMQRHPGAAEDFGLKISQLLLPITGHRLDTLNQLKAFHNANTLVTESDAASLGVIGSIGFLALLVQLLRRKEIVTSVAPGLFSDLSIMNVFAVLLGLVGGFGFLFAVLISSGIRCYNRISVFIAFFSLMAVAIGLERIYQRTLKSRRSIFYSLLAVALVAGVLDQTTPAYIHDYAAIKIEYLSDDQFVKGIENSVPPASMIFQLPYVPFPEFPPFNKMRDYDHFRGYVHSQNLRWSYGTMKNREGDQALQGIAALPIEELVQIISFAGFKGIYLDRFGYADNGAAIETKLSDLLQNKPIVSPNGRLVFFNLVDYVGRLREKYPDNEWEANEDLSFHPVLVDWKGGFSGYESLPGKTWRWCSSEGELHLRNTSQRPRTIRLEMSFATGYEQLDDLVISGLISEQLKVNATPSFFAKTITVPPGESVINFRSSAKRVYAPLDTRFLVFKVEDFKMTELQLKPN
jgi:phosphoglycerol transferase